MISCGFNKQVQKVPINWYGEKLGDDRGREIANAQNAARKTTKAGSSTTAWQPEATYVLQMQDILSSRCHFGR